MHYVWAALITVGGMVLVTMFNLLGTSWATRQETERLRQNLLYDWRLQQYRSWEKELRDSLAELIAEVDPQMPRETDFPKIISLVHRTQLMLEERDEKQAELNGALNALVLRVTGWGSSGDLNQRTLLELQNNLILAGKSVLYNPAKSPAE